MCMKNINTDVLIFEDINNSKTNNDLLNLYGITKNIPKIRVEESDENLFLIPQINLMLSINATDSKKEQDEYTIDFSKKYRICLRITETTSGQCVDAIQFDICPEENEINLCKKIFSQKSLYRFENFAVRKPPKGKNLCVLKVLIQEVVNGTISEDKWIAQSMHPIELIPN